MSSIPALKDFTKKVSGLLTQGFPVKRIPGQDEKVESSQAVAFSLKPRGDLTLATSITTKNKEKGATTGEIGGTLQIPDAGATLVAKFKTAGYLMAKATFDKTLPDGLTVSGAFEADQGRAKQDATIDVSYAHEHFRGGVSVQLPISQRIFDFMPAGELDQNVTVNGHVVTGLPAHNVYVAAEGKAQNADTFAPQTAKVLGLFKDGDFNATLGYAYAWGNPSGDVGEDGKVDEKTIVPASGAVQATFFTKVGDASVGAELEHKVNGAQGTTLAVGTGYPLNAAANVSARLDTNQRLGFAYAHQLSDTTKLSFGTMVTALHEAGSWNLSSEYAFKLDISQ